MEKRYSRGNDKILLFLFLKQTNNKLKEFDNLILNIIQYKG